MTRNLNKRKLTKWRREALKIVNSADSTCFDAVIAREQAARILDLTQELMDQILLLEEMGS